MDEIDLMKQIKKVFKYFNISFLCFALFLLIIVLLQGAFYKEINIYVFEHWFMFFLIMEIGLNLFLILVYSIIYIVYKLNYIKIDIEFNKEYIREFYQYYPPAIVSLIYDFKTEVYRDYTATILYLFTKKYVSITHFNKDVVIKKGTNENLCDLQRHELYVYNCLINKQKFDEKIFKENIFEDCKEKLLIFEEENENKKKAKIILIEMVLLICLIKLIGISDNEIWNIFITIIISTAIVGFIMFPVIMYNTEKKLNNYKLTKKGKQELKKIKAFKHFIKDYTLIEEKEIEYIQILEEYIPYSLSLGMSPQVEKYIKENEIYRNLIYKGREKWI